MGLLIRLSVQFLIKLFPVELWRYPSEGGETFAGAPLFYHALRYQRGRHYSDYYVVSVLRPTSA